MFGENDWRAKLSLTATKQPVECWQNVCVILDEHPAWRGCVGFDEFATRPVIRRSTPTGASAGEWTPDHTYELGLWLAQQEHITVKSLGALSEGVIACANRNKFNPVIEWLTPMVWDGVPRLDFWMHECLGVKEGPYAALVGRYFMMNVVARAFEPGCIMRSMPILEGAQNKGKSTALRLLAEPWFSDSHLDIGNKDAYEMIQGTLIYEIAEMHAFTKQEANKVKQFISSRDDNWVPKWVRGRIKVPRRMVFAGSINPDGAGYLRDWTGNTRFWPVRCMEDGPLDLDKVAQWREQLFAEAVFRYREKERRYPTEDEERTLFEPEQSERLTEHPFLEPIAEWLASRDAYLENVITAHTVLTKGVRMDISKQTQAMLQDVGRIMQLLGWKRKRSSNEGRPWYYERPMPGDADTPDRGGNG